MCVYQTHLLYLHRNIYSFMSHLLLAVLFIVVAIVAVVLTVHVFIPSSPIELSDKVHIYIGRKYNRTATIDDLDNENGVIFIYDNFSLPCTYFGKFYAVGYMSDGNKLIYLKNKKLLIPALLAELIRF